MKNTVLSLSLLCILFSACQQRDSQTSKVQNGEDTLSLKNQHVLTLDILTAEQQAKLTPAEVLERLKQGNLDFAKDNLTVRNNTERIRKASLGQFPKAAILSCLDSRVPVEDVFHSGIGNLFVARVAGNIVNEDILGSLEYACKVSGAKLVFVLGHEYCGAVKSAIDGVKLGNITALLAKIQPSVTTARASFKGETTSSNPAFVESVCDQNVKDAIGEIRKKSPILKEMEEKGEILIVGGVYDMNTGRVDFFN